MGQLHMYTSSGILMRMKIECKVTSRLLRDPNFCMTMYIRTCKTLLSDLQEALHWP